MKISEITNEDFRTGPVEIANTLPAVKMAKIAAKAGFYSVKSYLDNLRATDPKAWDRLMRNGASVTLEDWNKVNKRDKTDGLSQKAVNAYRRENPGSKLKTAVTTKPSKLKAGSKDAKRRKSFCARMSGNKGPMKKPNGKPTPKALALRRWNCESVEEMVDMIIENMDHSKDNQAVPELKSALLAKKATLQKATDDQVYDIIDTIMTRIAKSHGISGQKLHDMWVKEYDQIPDTWIMK